MKILSRPGHGISNTKHYMKATGLYSMRREPLMPPETLTRQVNFTQYFKLSNSQLNKIEVSSLIFTYCRC